MSDYETAAHREPTRPPLELYTQYQPFYSQVYSGVGTISRAVVRTTVCSRRVMPWKIPTDIHYYLYLYYTVTEYLSYARSPSTCIHVHTAHTSAKPHHGRCGSRSTMHTFYLPLLYPAPLQPYICLLHNPYYSHYVQTAVV